MPNGGYPLHFLAVLRGTGLALRSNGRHLELVKSVRPASGEEKAQLEVVGEFSRDQMSALVYHLTYWGGVLGAGKPLGLPQFKAAGCVYDY
jgi:hypothetical protein